LAQAKRGVNACVDEGMAQLHKERSYSAKAEYPVRLRPIGSITGISGILDHPPSRMMTVEGAARAWRYKLLGIQITDGGIPGTQFRDLAAHGARVWLGNSLPSDQRAQGMPGARCARGLVCTL